MDFLKASELTLDELEQLKDSPIAGELEGGPELTSFKFDSAV